MNERRTVVLRLRLENRWGFSNGVRIEFGPFWVRWWLIIRHGGKPHRTGIGEPCVVFPADEDNAGTS